MLPFFKTPVKELDQLQTRWKQVLDPISDNVLLKGRIVGPVDLQVGSNVIDHLLGRQPQGWIITDLNANVGVWRTAWTPLTLTLEASGPVTVALYVY